MKLKDNIKICLILLFGLVGSASIVARCHVSGTWNPNNDKCHFGFSHPTSGLWVSYCQQPTGYDCSCSRGMRENGGNYPKRTGYILCKNNNQHDKNSDGNWVGSYQPCTGNCNCYSDTVEALDAQQEGC